MSSMSMSRRRLCSHRSAKGRLLKRACRPARRQRAPHRTVRDTRQRIQPLAKRPRDMLEGGAGGKMR